MSWNYYLHHPILERDPNMFKQIQTLVLDVVDYLLEAPVRSFLCIALAIALLMTYRDSCKYANAAARANTQVKYIQTDRDLYADMLHYTLNKTNLDYNRIVTEMTIKKLFPPIDAERLLADN